MGDILLASDESALDIALPNPWALKPIKRRRARDEVHFASESITNDVVPEKKGRHTPIRQLVRRTCQCKASDCYRQFDSEDGMADIERTRAMYKGLNAEMQDVFISLNLLHRGISLQLPSRGPVANEDVHMASDEEAGLNCLDIQLASEGELNAQHDICLASDDEYCENTTTAKQDRATRAYKARARTKRRSCELAGKIVCVRAFARLLAVGTAKVERVRRGERALLCGKHPKHPVLGVSLKRTSGVMWPSVLMFLWHTYHSVAEGLPDRMLHLSELRSTSGVVARLGKEPASRLRNDDLDRLVSTLSFQLANHATDPDLAMKGPGTLLGPRRYLQHDAPIHLFWEYVAWARRSDDQTASYSTFLRVFNKVFRSHLQFRKGGNSQHSECSVCNGIKAELRRTANFMDKLEIMERYTEHLLLQWLDRQVWWAMCAASSSWFLNSAKLGREASFASVSLSVGAVIADRMDQAKFRLPRMRCQGSRQPKAMDALHRPCVHVLGIWMQGFALDLLVSHEDMKSDSCSQVEGIARMLDKVLATYGMLPLGLHLQQDNCIREAKNSHIANFMMILVLIGVFKWTVLGYLRKGHTHENIDQVKG